MPGDAAENDLFAAQALAAEISASSTGRTPWRKVETLLQRFEMASLNSKHRERMQAALVAVGLHPDPALTKVARKGHVRFLSSKPDEAIVAPPPQSVAPDHNRGENATGPRVFISYRRQDCQPQANGLSYGLCHRLPAASVFMDIDSIPAGEDFEQHIRREIESCDIVLVLIGDNWLDNIDGTDERRIDHPDDFVRLEVEAALQRSVKVIPVLVEGANMPRSDLLPRSIRRLARINAIELSDQRFKADMERLATLIEGIGRHAAIAKADVAVPFSSSPTPSLELPAKVTSAWLRDNVPRLDGAQLAALAETLSHQRGWSDDEIEDDVFLRVDSPAPLVEALRLRGWSEDEITGLVACLDDGGGPVSLEIPSRVTERWLEENVPRLAAEQLAELCQVLRRRRWSEGWLIDFVYSLASPDARPPRRPRPGNPARSRLTLPRRITDGWLRKTVDGLDGDSLAALIDELHRRGWSEGQIEDGVFARIERQ